MNEGGEAPHPDMTMDTLTREGMLALFAGSDTTATAMSNIIFYLTMHPDVTTRLRAELDAATGEGVGDDADIDAANRLVDLKYLQAVINEVLRLQPAVPNGVQRVPPPGNGSVVLAGQYATLISIICFVPNTLLVLFLLGRLFRSQPGAVGVSAVL
jgi:cytochrome P450